MVAIERGDDLTVIPDTYRRAMAGELREWKVQTIVVGPMPYQDNMVALVRSLLGREGSAEGGVYVWWNVTPTELSAS
jgi:hypothetical protein